jgi:catechol 2,3-dioxygenase-like lactoylglutathione lyase family enzyme
VSAGALEPRLNLVTLASADIARAARFYKETLGWTPFVEADDIAFFDLGGVVLGFWTTAGLAGDVGAGGAGAGAERAPDARGFALSHNCRSEADVDGAFARLRAAGASILKAPHKTEWGGYSGYFADPDGNAWEIAFNPHWPLDVAGRIVPPKPS